MLFGNKGLLNLLRIASFQLRSLLPFFNKIYIINKIYCVRRRTKTETIDLHGIVSKNGRPMLRGKCAACGTIKTQFVSMQEGGDITRWLSPIAHKFEAPWAEYPGEKHIPGMRFAGPFTRLDKRLDSYGRPKPDSLPVDRVDEAAYHHDLAYAAFPDTKRRNVADRVMISELDAIPNPTLRERAERAIIKPILRTKARFGLGTKKNCRT